MSEQKDNLEARWDALYAQARMVLDDEGVEREEKRRAVAAKKLKRAGLEAPPVDLRKVKETLLEYSECLKYMDAVNKTGIARREMTAAFDLWAEAKTVEEYICRIRDEEYKRKRADVVTKLRDQLETLAMDDKGECHANVKAVLFGLERLDKGFFSDPRNVEGIGGDEGRALPGRGGGGILININGDAARISAAPPEPDRLGGKAQVFIDV